MVNFDTTKEEAELIDKIIFRALEMGYRSDRLSLHMDLSAAHANGCPLDFSKLLAFDDFNFSHDISGIYRNINRAIGKLENCFEPRCAKSLASIVNDGMRHASGFYPSEAPK